jgi:CCR4-NOT transcription complex subunit 2
MWATTGSRNLSGPVQRNQPTPLSSQAAQDDLFSPSSSRMPSAHGSFRFGNQGNVPPSQGQPSTSEEFPPLNRNGNGEIGSERIGFATQNGVPGSLQGNRGNGLLNALSATSRANDARSPSGGEQTPLLLHCLD